MAYKHRDGVWAGGSFAYGTSGLRLGKILGIALHSLHRVAIKEIE